jgi:NADH-quinone oxidoreductase subunit M
LLPYSNKNYLKARSFLLSVIPLLLLVYGDTMWLNTSFDHVWLPALNIHFYLHIDSLSLLFLYLTAFVVPMSILAVNVREQTNPNGFYGLVLLLQGLLFGFFMARDLALFTIFWEGMLLPLYFLMTLWGGPKRQEAALKFLIYMIAGSFLMVAATLALYFVAQGGQQGGIGTFNLDSLTKIAQTAPHATWVAAIFLLAFAVKTPLFPFHGWLPDTYTQASPPSTILLSAILSKAGIYGVLRIGIGLFPTLVQEWSPYLVNFALVGVFYGAFAAWTQRDFKRLIAYSSLSHVNFILVGLFVWSHTAQVGAVLQALNHGITITALFLVASWLEERAGSTSLSATGGLAHFMPRLCWFTLIFVLSSVALPATNSFVGELLILFGVFSLQPYLAAVLGISVIFSVVYMLRFMQKVYFEEPQSPYRNWVDLSLTEFVTTIPLILLIFWIGIYPTPVLDQIKQIPFLAEAHATPTPEKI